MTEQLKNLTGAPDVLEHFFLGDPVQRDFGMVVFQPGRPIEAGELNFAQQVVNHNIRNLVRLLAPRPSVNVALSGAGVATNNTIRLHTSPFTLTVDGLIKYIDDTGHVEDQPLHVTLPAWTANGRIDTVLAELWFEEIQSATSGGTSSADVPVGGREGSTNTLPNDIRIPAIDLSETTRRTQLRWRIRSVIGQVNHVSGGVTNAEVPADMWKPDTEQEGNDKFYKVYGETAHMNGLVAEHPDIRTVDNKVYAVPLLRVTRGANAATMTTVANLTNRITFALGAS